MSGGRCGDGEDEDLGDDGDADFGCEVAQRHDESATMELTSKMTRAATTPRDDFDKYDGERSDPTRPRHHSDLD